MDNSALARLKAHEGQFDATARGLRLWRLPRRSILTALHGILAQHFHGAYDRQTPSFPDKGEALIGRMSYLAQLLELAPLEPFGTSWADAMSPFSEDSSLLSDLLFAIQYGHFSELMPEVHRGYYTVSENGSCFKLSHRKAQFADSERTDIILTELSRPTIVSRVGADDGHLHELVRAAAGNREQGDLRALAILCRELSDIVLHQSVEVSLVGAANFEPLFGVARDEFVRFRAAWCGISQAFLEIAGVWRASRDKGSIEEYHEWVAPAMNSNFIGGLAISIAGLAEARFAALMDLFAFSPTKAGDGYWPPFHHFGPAVVFCPDIVIRTLSERNLLYGLNKCDRKRFDDAASRNLEPQLVSAAAKQLRKLGCEVAEHVAWAHGEIDLLAADRESGAVVQVQAKAPIPPQGARMTQQVTARSIEGLHQLAAFRAIAPSDQAAVIKSATGLDLTAFDLWDLLLCGASVGGADAWNKLGKAVVCTPAVLALAVEDLLRNNKKLRSLPVAIQETMSALTQEFSLGWHMETILGLGPIVIEAPMLRLDNTGLRKRALHAQSLGA
jgi:Holliday junction resolvase-like predicted endonuclease